MFEGTYRTADYLAGPRICCNCGEPGEFYRKNRKCKACVAKQMAKWYQENKAACAARKRAYRARKREALQWKS